MAITTVHNELIAVNAVSGTAIADNAVTSVHIAKNNIGTVQIAQNSVTSVSIAENNVTGTQIANNAVTSTQLADNAVTATKIPDGTQLALGTTAFTGDLTITTAGPSISLVDSDNNPDYQIKNGNGSFRIIDTTNSVDRINIDTSGNVGIGISPSKKLTVYGTGAGEATVQIEGEGGADPYINFLANNTQHWSLGIDDSDSDKFKLSEHSALGTNDYFTVDTSGNVGIGTNSPNDKLHIKIGTNLNWQFGYPNSSVLIV